MNAVRVTTDRSTEPAAHESRRLPAPDPRGAGRPAMVTGDSPPAGGNLGVDHRLRPGRTALARPRSDGIPAGSGQPLPGDIRAAMESRFGHEFGHVRVHTGSRAAAMATALTARAYTVGSDIVFNTGRFAPYTLDGRRLLAHELAHVVQQQRGGAVPLLDSAALHERSAREAATAVVNGRGPVDVAGGTQAGVACDGEPPSSAPPRVLVLGLYERPFPGGRVLPAHDALLKEAAAATGLRPMLMGGMEKSFKGTWRDLAPSGLASATLVQEALEGGGEQNIRAIYINESGVRLLAKYPPGTSAARQVAHPEGTFHTAAEYRSVVASLAANTHKVDIYIRHSKGLSIVRAGRQVVEGQALPAQLRPHLPRSFVTEPPRGGPAPPSGTPPSGAPSPPVPPASAARGVARGKEGPPPTSRFPAIRSKSLPPTASTTAPRRASGRGRGTSPPSLRKGDGRTAPPEAPVPPRPRASAAPAKVAPKTAAVPATPTRGPEAIAPTVTEPPVTVTTPAVKPEAEVLAPKLNTKAAFRSSLRRLGGIKGAVKSGARAAGSAAKGAAVALALDLITAQLKQWGVELQIERETEEQLHALQPQFEALLATSPKEIHAIVHVMVFVTTKVDLNTLEERSGFPVASVRVSLATQGVPPSESQRTEDYGTGSVTFSNYTYSMLLLDVEKERKRQEVARKEEALREHLRELAKREAEKAPARKPAPPPPPARRAPDDPFSLVTPAEQAPSLLPGWPGPGPGAKEHERARGARVVAHQLLSQGQRISRHGAKPGELPDFKNRVTVWRGLVEKMIRDFSDQTAVADLQNLLYEFNERIERLGVP